MAMGERILLCGATGVVGRRLIRLLREAGHRVVGTTRSSAKAADLRRLGVEPMVVDVFDAGALKGAVRDAAPRTVIHQLTDLPPGLDAAGMAEAVPRNVRIRDEGTRNLVAAALAAGAERVVAQSIGWAYAPGPLPHHESDPLDGAAEGDRAISVRGVAALERHVLAAPPMIGIVLRYGQLYGPGTGREQPSGAMPLHVDAAASAALLPLGQGVCGVFNVAEPNATVATGKAVAALGWRPDFRLAVPD